MGLETGNYISDLVITNPTGVDQKLQGDDHLRLIKKVVKQTFPNLDGAVNATPEILNAFSALFPLTDDYFIRANGTDALELRSPAQVRSDVGADNASNLTSGTIPEARLPTTLSNGYNFDTVELKFGQGLTAFPTGYTQASIYRTGAFAGAPAGFTSGTAGHLILQARSNSAAATGVLIAAGQQGVDQAIVFAVRLGVALVNGDNVELRFGAGGDDLAIYHDGADNYLDANTGHMILRGNGSNSVILRDGSDTARVIVNDTVGATVTPVAGPSQAEIGFRKIVRQTTGGTLTADMSGTCQAVSAGVTVNDGVFAAGDTVQIYNNSASSITITQDTGMTLRLAGTATTGNRTLAPRGFAFIWFNTASEAIVSGNVS